MMSSCRDGGITGLSGFDRALQGCCGMPALGVAPDEQLVAVRHVLLDEVGLHREQHVYDCRCFGCRVHVPRKAPAVAHAEQVGRQADIPHARSIGRDLVAPAGGASSLDRRVPCC